ncbi:hypothetical protein [Bacillus sp. AK128]
MFYFQNEMLAKQRVSEVEKKATHAWKFAPIQRAQFSNSAIKESTKQTEVSLPCQKQVCCATI